jgi:hypothetical protein
MSKPTRMEYRECFIASTFFVEASLLRAYSQHVDGNQVSANMHNAEDKASIRAIKLTRLFWRHAYRDWHVRLEVCCRSWVFT